MSLFPSNMLFNATIACLIDLFAHPCILSRQKTASSASSASSSIIRENRACSWPYLSFRGSFAWSIQSSLLELILIEVMVSSKHQEMNCRGTDIHLSFVWDNIFTSYNSISQSTPVFTTFGDHFFQSFAYIFETMPQNPLFLCRNLSWFAFMQR